MAHFFFGSINVNVFSPIKWNYKLLVIENNGFRTLQPYLSSLFFQPLEHTKLELTPHKGPGRPGGGPVKIKKGEIFSDKNGMLVFEM
jgi:hypothetical protein